MTFNARDGAGVGLKEVYQIQWSRPEGDPLHKHLPPQTPHLVTFYLNLFTLLQTLKHLNPKP